MDTKNKPQSMDLFDYLSLYVKDEIDDFLPSIINWMYEEIHGVHRLRIDISDLSEDEKQFLPVDLVGKYNSCCWKAEMVDREVDLTSNYVDYIITDKGG